MTILEAVGAGVWVVCGVLAYGRSFAYLADDFPYFAWDDQWLNVAMSGFTAMLGPVGLIGILAAAMIEKSPMAFRYRLYTEAESRKAYETMWGPYLQWETRANKRKF